MEGGPRHVNAVDGGKVAQLVEGSGLGVEEKGPSCSGHPRSMEKGKGLTIVHQHLLLHRYTR